MLRHDHEKIYVYDPAKASRESFFNGSLNTLELDFDPLIVGFSFIKWTALPKWVTDAYPGFSPMTEKNFKEFSGLTDIELEVAPIQHGFNANEYNIATGIKKNNTEFTIKHQEYSGSPMKNMYQYWISGIRDPETGISTYGRLSGLDYAAKNHTGELIYIVTRPDANNVDRENIEFACYYTAVMPKKIALSHFNHTQGTHDPVDYEQTFSGVFHMGAKVDSFARIVLAERTYGFLEFGEFDPTNPQQGLKNIAHGYDDSTPDKIGSSKDLNITRGNAVTSS